jgi:hypothetical protein
METDHPTKWIAEELQGITLPDKRFSANIISIAERLAEYSGFSFSAACGERLRKSAWRLFSTEELELLSVHQHRTMDRCASEQIILIVEDTTDIVYRQQQKQGMGELGSTKSKAIKGLNMHTALALSDAGEPLGIIHQQIWAPKVHQRATTNTSKIAIEDKETIKWINTLKTVNRCWQQQQQQQVVLISDREADFFEHYGQPRQDNIKLLVRVQQKKRIVQYKDKKLSIAQVLKQLTPLGQGQVRVWRRPNQPERIAQVHYYATTITLPPTYKQKLAARTMQLVWIKEEQEPPPEQQVVEENKKKAEPIEWVLLTDLAADSLQEVVTIGSYYACRWTAERFHYILKSGLHIEQVQIDSYVRLVNALQLYALIGWHLLWLQRLAKANGDQAASEFIESQTLEAAQAVSGKQISTVKDFLVVTAVLGGFIPTRKQPLPGEKTLWLGLRQLLAIRKGFIAAKLKYGTG